MFYYLLQELGRTWLKITKVSLKQLSELLRAKRNWTEQTLGLWYFFFICIYIYPEESLEQHSSISPKASSEVNVLGTPNYLSYIHKHTQIDVCVREREERSLPCLQ